MKFKLFILSVILASSAWAGGCWTDTAVSQTGVGFRATISVFNTVPALATLYSDPGLTQPMDNTFRSSPNGRFQFCTTRGFYSVMVTGPGVTTYSYNVYVNDGTSTSTVSFKLCSGVPCTTSLTSDPSIVTSTGTINGCWLTAGTLPTTSNLIVDVRYNGTSIYTSGTANQINLTPSGGVVSKAPTTPVAITAGGVIKAFVTAIGSGTAGQDVVVTCQVSLN